MRLCRSATVGQAALGQESPTGSFLWRSFRRPEERPSRYSEQVSPPAVRERLQAQLRRSAPSARPGNRARGRGGGRGSAPRAIERKANSAPGPARCGSGRRSPRAARRRPGVNHRSLSVHRHFPPRAKASGCQPSGAVCLRPESALAGSSPPGSDVSLPGVPLRPDPASPCKATRPPAGLSCAAQGLSSARD